MPKNSDKGTLKTGIVWGWRFEDEQFFSGKYDTRHEAIGYAVILGRIAGKETDVRWRESIWHEAETPTVCGFCGYETHYLPLVKWTFADVDESPFCSTECWARYQRVDSPEVQD